MENNVLQLYIPHNYYVPQTKWGNILVLLGFLLLLLRSSVSTEDLIVILKFFLYYYYYFSFFLQSLWTQFLRDPWFDFSQIFRNDRYWLELESFFSNFENVNSDVRYWRFNDFQRGTLSSSVLRNYQRYELEIFSDCKGDIVDMPNDIHFFETLKLLKLARPWKNVTIFTCIFAHSFLHIFSTKNNL